MVLKKISVIYIYIDFNSYYTEISVLEYYYFNFSRNVLSLILTPMVLKKISVIYIYIDFNSYYTEISVLEYYYFNFYEMF